MKWIKKGPIYCAGNTSGWAQSYAAIPTPFPVSDSVLRIYCSFRGDEPNISRVGYVDVQADNPRNVIGVSSQPILDIGTPGAFDDHGVLPASIVRDGNALYLYYSGFQLRSDVPYYLLGGVAISFDGGASFQRLQATPILGSSPGERFFRTAPHVIKDGALWKMWYIAGDEWVEGKGKKLPVYAVKYLESPDGIRWGRQGLLCFAPQGDEHGFGRPYVAKDASGYHMYYSIRTLSKGYRLGYAFSQDGRQWQRRDDEMELNISDHGWDSESICYSAVITHGNRTYCFYNGNYFGQTGFGYAELDRS